MSNIRHILLSAWLLAAVSCTREEPAGECVPLTPAWALGHIVWEDEFNTQEAVLRLVDGYLEHDIPVSGVIIDSPWTTAYNDFTWDRSLYPEPEALLAQRRKIPGRNCALDEFPLFVRAGSLLPLWKDGRRAVLVVPGDRPMKAVLHYPTGDGCNYEDVTVRYHPRKGVRCSDKSVTILCK